MPCASIKPADAEGPRWRSSFAAELGQVVEGSGSGRRLCRLARQHFEVDDQHIGADSPQPWRNGQVENSLA